MIKLRPFYIHTHTYVTFMLWEDSNVILLVHFIKFIVYKTSCGISVSVNLSHKFRRYRCIYEFYANTGTSVYYTNSVCICAKQIKIIFSYIKHNRQNPRCIIKSYFVYFLALNKICFEFLECGDKLVVSVFLL